MEAAFENGYDSDGENQPYTGVWNKEGDQLFEEEAVPSWIADAAAADITNAIHWCLTAPDGGSLLRHWTGRHH